MHSALCTGTLEHGRCAPVAHHFRYPAHMLYLDLAETGDVFALSRLWSNTGPAPVWLRRADYLGDPARPLDECVRDEVQARVRVRPAGPIRMLTHPRHFGFAMNPLTAYFCFNTSGNTIEWIVGEVTNTPWNEKHVYVWPAEAVVRSLTQPGHRCPKAFHVSPFMPMEQTYHVRAVHRQDALALRIDTEESGATIFSAQVILRKRPITAAALRRAALQHPFTTAQVFARIYWQAFRLWRKRAPFFPHPKSKPKEGVTSEHQHLNV